VESYAYSPDAPRFSTQSEHRTTQNIVPGARSYLIRSKMRVRLVGSHRSPSALSA
jgi:hypothetical protein